MIIEKVIGQIKMDRKHPYKSVILGFIGVFLSGTIGDYILNTFIASCSSWAIWERLWLAEAISSIEANCC